MFEIDSAHAITGSVILPPNPDLFTLTSMLAFISRRPLQVTPRIDRATCGAWRRLLETCLDFKDSETGCLVCARALDTAKPLLIPNDDMPFSDYIAGMLLSKGFTLAVPYATGRMLDAWKNRVSQAGGALKLENQPEQTLVRMETGPGTLPQAAFISSNEIHPVLGLFHGSGKAIAMRIENPWINPLRHILTLLGYPLTCSSNSPRPPSDPLARRIAQMQQAGKKQSEINPGFSLSIDFSAALSPEPLAVSLPGDDVLGALLIGAKSLVQRGNLIIENLPTESWALPTLLLVRKMGCKIGEQVTGETSFGQVGSLQLQRFEVAGRRTDCVPLFQFRAQLPMMVMISAYGAGQSIFRSLEFLHSENPDGIAQIHTCLDIIGIRHGEMPDGIVVDGNKRYDGFDMPASLPAALAGALAMLALKCTGKSTINDEFILKRWPHFKKMLDDICKARE